ncbi:MAG: class I SAM-dependent methyltransferase [Candidatus Beckwithbacteria bacterium]
MKKIDFLTLFSQKFWYAPADVLIRAKEGLIWSNQKISSPSLDIGCGDGSISQLFFSQLKPINYGLDINPDHLSEALKTRIYKKVVCADAAKLPFKSNQFQTVISNSTFEHIKNDLLAVKEVSRVLRPKGVFILTVVSSRLKPLMNQKINQRVYHFHYRSLADWRKIFKVNNLKIIKSGYYLPPSAMKLWLKLFKLATFKPYKRELWSYLQVSFLTPIWPKKLTSLLIQILLRPYYYPAFNQDGTWLFIKAVKQSK